MDDMETPVAEQVETQPVQESEVAAEKPAKKPNGFLRAVGFDAIKKKTTIKTEIIAGIVTFLAMAYILTVNPNQILFAGVRTVVDGEVTGTFVPTDNVLWPSIFIATAFGAVIGTLLMAFLARMPLAQASGMGLNSMLGGVIGGGAGLISYTYNFTIGQAFMMVLISGIIFLLLYVIKIKGKTFRELVFDGMPVAVRSAISVGIGLFIAFIGFQNAHIIVGNQYTLVDLVAFSKYDVNVNSAVVCLSGLFLIAIFDKLNVKGSVIFGILGAAIVGIPLGVTKWWIAAGNEPGISWKFWENFGNFFAVGETSVFGSFTSVFTEGFPAGSLFTIIMLIITMCMIDMFDTMGTIVGCCSNNSVLSDETGKPHRYGQIMMSDAIATCTGAMLGTSTVTTFVESGAGVSAGGRTGLTAFTTACLFFLSMFALPLFAAIPSAAAASALIYVGVLMMKGNVKNIDLSNAINATAAFLTISVMVLAYSITKGIGVGMISWTLMSIVSYLIELIKYAITKKEKPVWNVSIVSIVVSLLFCLFFFVPTTL